METTPSRSARRAPTSGATSRSCWRGPTPSTERPSPPGAFDPYLAMVLDVGSRADGAASLVVRAARSTRRDGDVLRGCDCRGVGRTDGRVGSARHGGRPDPPSRRHRHGAGRRVRPSRPSRWGGSADAPHRGLAARRDPPLRATRLRPRPGTRPSGQRADGRSDRCRLRRPRLPTGPRPPETLSQRSDRHRHGRPVQPGRVQTRPNTEENSDAQAQEHHRRSRAARQRGRRLHAIGPRQHRRTVRTAVPGSSPEARPPARVRGWSPRVGLTWPRARGVVARGSGP